MNFSDLSYELTKSLDKNIKKSNGIYFTPPETVSNILTKLEPYIKHNLNILEPSCGSCEFINQIKHKFPTCNITGIEYNKDIYNKIKDLNCNQINIKNEDYLKYNITQKYGLIIGNPPYYVMKQNEITKLYSSYFDGRPNIFLLFIIKSIHHLDDDGILSFVLPKNFLNCLYYTKTREYIIKNLKIISIDVYKDSYIETQQETIVLNIQKTTEYYDNSEYYMKRNNYYILGDKKTIQQLQNLYSDSTTLSELNFKVKVGNVTWNDNKDKLTDNSNATRLIYNSDIKDNILRVSRFKDEDKKNYINKDGINIPTLLINRGYGVGKYVFNYCILDTSFPYLLENHILYLESNVERTNEELLEKLHKIKKSFEDERTKQFISLYFGNNAINTTELNFIMPIYNT